MLQSVEDGQVNILYVTPEYVVNKADQLKARLGDLSQVPLLWQYEPYFWHDFFQKLKADPKLSAKSLKSWPETLVFGCW